MKIKSAPDYLTKVRVLGIDEDGIKELFDDFTDGNRGL